MFAIIHNPIDLTHQGCDLLHGAGELLEVKAPEHLEDGGLVGEEGVGGHPVPQHVDLGLLVDQRQLGPEHELEHGHGEAAVVAAPGILVFLLHVEAGLEVVFVH